MADISTVQYGQEHGRNLIKIYKKLLENQNLLKLLVNADLDPLNPARPDIKDPLQEILNTYIKVVPLMLNEDSTTKSKLVLFFDSSMRNGMNPDQEDIVLLINVYCPFKEWLIAGDTLRPFAIMSEIRKSIQDKRINGLGQILYEGYGLATLTEEMGCYSMRFSINAFT